MNDLEKESNGTENDTRKSLSPAEIDAAMALWLSDSTHDLWRLTILIVVFTILVCRQFFMVCHAHQCEFVSAMHSARTHNARTYNACIHIMHRNHNAQASAHTQATTNIHHIHSHTSTFK